MAEKQEQKELTGVLFKNEKMTNEKSPMYMGKCMVNGKFYYVSGWVNKSNDGTKSFMSLRFNEPKTNEQNDPTVPEDDIPF